MKISPSSELLLQILEASPRVPEAEERRVEERYDSVEDYDPVLRAHCRL